MKCQLHAPSALKPEELQVPTDRKQNESQGRFGRRGEGICAFLLSVLEPHILSSVTTRTELQRLLESNGL
jgi:hypothetical protein